MGGEFFTYHTFSKLLNKLLYNNVSRNNFTCNQIISTRNSNHFKRAYNCPNALTYTGFKKINNCTKRWNIYPKNTCLITSSFLIALLRIESYHFMKCWDSHDLDCLGFFTG